MLHRAVAIRQHPIRSLHSHCFSQSACTRSRFRAPFKPGQPVVMLAADDVHNRYRGFSRKELLGRIATLEQSLDPSSSSSSSGSLKAQQQDIVDPPPPPPSKRHRLFDIKRYPCRKIALRFSYDGEAYCGLEMQTAAASSGSSHQGEAVPTVEGMLWKALCDARLVEDAEGLTGVGWSRCGRTDRGVSSAGQVVALWLRSKRVDQWPLRRAHDKMKETGQDRVNDEDAEMPTFQERRLQKEAKVRELAQIELDAAEAQEADDTERRVHADPDAEELPYLKTLNSILPPSIRIQAWSPVSPAFDARFDCRYRHYKYFFTNGAPFIKRPHSYGPVPRLDIALMRKAAQRLLGEHDFRNFCKIDPSKVITNFYRRIDGISIDRVGRRWTQEPPEQQGNKDEDTDMEDMYVLNLRGSAFLYHQVRHIMSVLFLVGARLEKPSIVDELLNVKPGGLYSDRIASVKLNGLRLSADDKDTTPAAPLTELPPAIDAEATEAAGGLVSHYSHLRLDASSSDAESAGLSQDDVEALAPLRDLLVFDRRPLYDMAMDRPLMLWECGFDESDVQWRASTYDGPMDEAAVAAAAKSASASMSDSPTPYSRALLYSAWNAQSITTELYRHFTLALPQHNEGASASQSHGYMPASTTFSECRHPAMQSTAAPTANGGISSHDDHEQSKLLRNLIPLGYGKFKCKPVYGELRKAQRMATPTEKYEAFQASRGRRKAERIAAAAAATDTATTDE